MISIVIPTYMEEGCIETTLRNLKVPGREYEVIVSDSGSPDRTVEIAKRYADKIVVLPKGRKRSVAQGRNDGARAAKGEYLVFIDADIMIPEPPAFLARALAAFARDPRLIGITVRIEHMPENKRWSDAVVFALRNICFAAMNNVFRFGMAAGEFQMIKTSAFRATGGFDENLQASEDIDLFHRLTRFGRVRTIWSLAVFDAARRFHQRGAFRTAYRWIRNTVTMWLFGRSFDKEWETIR